MKLETYFKKYKIFLFAGNGGTGKTTLSATWALEAAHRGQRVGLVTIDPSRRLGEAFGMNILEDSYKRHEVGKSYVDVHLVHSAKIIKEFIVENFSEQQYQSMTENKLFKQVVTRLAENQSLSTIYKLSQLIHSADYDIIVIDTPPAGHAVDFFRSPENAIRLFKENILAKTVFEGQGFAAKSAKRIFVQVLSFLTGAEFVNQMEVFFKGFFAFQEKIVEAAEHLTKVLSGEEVCFFLVTLPEPSKVQELTDVFDKLSKQGSRTMHLIVNRSHPDWFKFQKNLFSERWPVAKKYYDKVYDYYDNQKMILQNTSLQKTSGKGPLSSQIYFIPEKNYFSKEISLDELRQTLNEVFV